MKLGNAVLITRYGVPRIYITAKDFGARYNGDASAAAAVAAAVETAATTAAANAADNSEAKVHEPQIGSAQMKVGLTASSENKSDWLKCIIVNMATTVALRSDETITIGREEFS